jgi:Zn-dependent protease
LDGYAALEPHLSAATQRALEPAKQFGFMILIVLLIAPGLNRWFFSLVFWFFDLSGVSANLAMFGGQLTRFWSAWL